MKGKKGKKMDLTPKGGGKKNPKGLLISFRGEKRPSREVKKIIIKSPSSQREKKRSTFTLSTQKEGGAKGNDREFIDLGRRKIYISLEKVATSRKKWRKGKISK